MQLSDSSAPCLFNRALPLYVLFMIIIFIILYPSHVLSHYAKQWANSCDVHLCPKEHGIHVELKGVSKKFLYGRTKMAITINEDALYGLPRETMQFVTSPLT